MRSAIGAASLLLLAACGTRERLIKNYELLPVPVAATQYEAGRGWNTAIGAPDTPRPPEVAIATHAGLASLDTTSDRTLVDLNLKLPVIEWIGGKLGMKKTEKITVKLTGLRHTSVQDARALKETGAILWETISAESIELTLDTTDSAELDLTADLLKSKLEQGSSEPISLHVSRSGTGKYVIGAREPLVVAVRVVRLDWRRNSAETPLDISFDGRGREQSAHLGYRVTPRDPIDPGTYSLRLAIRNPGFPMWAGTHHDFRDEAPVWVNMERGVITSADDPERGDARFIWDAMTVLWEEDLSQCRLATWRQYVALREESSGLKGTR